MPVVVLAAAVHQYLAGEDLHYQVTFSLNFRRARSRLQLEPGVVADNWDLLKEEHQTADAVLMMHSSPVTTHTCASGLGTHI